MNAPTQSRVYAGYLIRASMTNGKTEFIGPFASEARACEYCIRMAHEMPNELGKAEVEELIVPHAMKVFIETQY